MYNPYKQQLHTLERQRGLSLIELILYVGVASVILVGVSTFVQAMLETQVRNQVVARVEESGAQAMTQLVAEIRAADAITQPSVGNTASALELDTMAGSVTYEIEDGTLIRTDGGPRAKLTSDSVSVTAFSVDHMLSGMVVIDLTLAYDTDSARSTYKYSQTFHTTVGIRSKQSSP